MINVSCSKTQHSDAGDARNYSIAAHSTKIKMRGSREEVAEGPDPYPGKSETFGLYSNTGPDPLENQKLPSQHSILGNYRPAGVLLLVVF